MARNWAGNMSGWLWWVVTITSFVGLIAVAWMLDKKKRD
jgi:hypothetical protein